MSKLIPLVIVSLCAVAGAAEPGKTAEQQFKNIQVLKGIPATQVGPAMDVMSSALGVGCPHCHVAAPNGPWPMEKDDKQAKRTARKMVTMMQQINKQFFGGDQVVTCATCHNGSAEPKSFIPLDAIKPEQQKKKVEAARPTVTVQQLFDKWTQASGGAAAWGKLRTRVSKGGLEGWGDKAIPTEIVQAAPDKYAQHVDGPRGAIDTVWNGSDGARRVQDRVFPLNASDVTEMKRDGVIAPPLTLQKQLAGAKVVADAPVGKGTAHVVEGKEGDQTVRLFFDAASGLLVRVSVLLPTAVGDLPQQFDYEDFRTVDGVKLPFVVRTNTGGEATTETFTSIQHNVPVDEARFVVPKATPPAQGK